MRHKTRLLSLRLSDEEYEGLRNLCNEKNSITMSALARLAIQHMLVGKVPPPAEDIEFRVEELRGRVTILGNQVQKLYSLIGERDEARASM